MKSFGAALALVLLTSFAPAAFAGDCATAYVPEPFVLPDGSNHGPGSLTVCFDHRYSPVAFMHRTYVDGMGVALHAGRRWLSEGSATDRPYMIFERAAAGRLTLRGYALPGRKHMEVYTLENATQKAEAATVPPVVAGG